MIGKIGKWIEVLNVMVSQLKLVLKSKSLSKLIPIIKIMGKKYFKQKYFTEGVVSMFIAL